MIPILSIVTATLQRRGMLERALASVDERHGDEIEHIVVDGGSTDGTRELIQGRGELRSIIAPGSGLYEAMDIGIRAASGRMILLLNSDDTLAPGGLSAILKMCASAPNAALVSGQAEVVHDDGAIEPCGSALVAPRLFARGPVTINARAFSRDAYIGLGGFDPAYPIGADRDFLFRLAIRKTSMVDIPETVYRYRAHGGSLTMSTDRSRRIAMAKEHLCFLEECLSHPALPASWRDWLLTGAAVEEMRLARLEPKHSPGRLASMFKRDARAILRLSAEVAGRILPRTSDQ